MSFCQPPLLQAMDYGEESIVWRVPPARYAPFAGSSSRPAPNSPLSYS